MKNSWKATILCVLGLMMTCMVALWAEAEQAAVERVTLDGVNYRLQGGAAYIESFDYSATRIEVHAIVEGLPMKTTEVSSLASGKATELLLCEGIEGFAPNSFMHWKLLKTVCLPESFMRWGGGWENSFTGCPKNMTFVVYPGSYAEVVLRKSERHVRVRDASDEYRLMTLDGVTYRLQDGAAYIDSVDFLSERVVVHDKVAGIPMKTKAFFYDKPSWDEPRQVREVVLCEGIEVIVEYCFDTISSLERVVLPKSLRSINACAFRSTHSLQSIELPEGLACIDQRAFHNTGLREILIPEGVLEIGDEAFESAHDLTRVVLPNSLQSIGYMAFADTALTNVNIPSGVREIGSRAFDSCNSLLAIDADPENKYYSSVDGVLFDKAGRTLLDYPKGRGGAYRIAEGVMIESELGSPFRGARLLETVILPQGMTELPHAAFQECVSLTQILLPETLTYIGQHAFMDCEKLSVLRIPAGVQEIDFFAFDGCAPDFSIIGPRGSYAENYAWKNALSFSPDP